MDALLVDGDLTPRGRLVAGDDAVLQRVRLRLGLFVGEWVLDQTVGLPWLEWMSTKSANRVQEVGAVLQATIETTPGVRRVLDWSGTYDPATRTATYAGVFLLDSGVTVVGEVATNPAADPAQLGAWLVVSFHRR